MKKKFLTGIVILALVLALLMPTIGTIAFGFDSDELTSEMLPAEIPETVAVEEPAPVEESKPEVKTGEPAADPEPESVEEPEVITEEPAIDEPAADVEAETEVATVAEEIAVIEDTEATEEAEPIEETAEVEPVVTEEAEPVEETAEPENTEVTEEPEAANEVKEPVIEEIPTEETEDVAEDAVELKLAFTNVPAFVVLNGKVAVTLTVEGGIAPYTVKAGDDVFTLDADGQLVLNAVAAEGGVLKITVEAEDAEGNSAVKSCEIAVSVPGTGEGDGWIGKALEAQSGLTGSWRQDILKIAETQIGSSESGTDFVKDADGTVRGYTVYGDICGHPYGDWNAMFVSFCARYANINCFDIVNACGCSAWISRLEDAFAYLTEYEPKPGDPVFLYAADLGSDEYRMGIISKVESDTLYVIEGDSEGCVKEIKYDSTEWRICGYGDMDMLQAYIRIAEELAVELGIEETVAAENEDAGLSPEIAAWAAEVGATEEMIERAVNAKSLDSLVMEGDELVYVRTGEVFARYDAEMGILIDTELGIPVAMYNETTDTVSTAPEDDAQAE